MAILAADRNLSADVTTDGRVWTVLPRVTAPAGRVLHYQISANKTGISGRSQTRQAGVVIVGPDGAGSLSTLRLGVGPDDRCDITIRLFDGSELVGDLSLQLPR